VGCDAARPRGQTQRLVVGALPGTLIVIALRLSEITGRSVRRAQDAPRALRYSRSWRVHLSRQDIWTTQSRSRVAKISSGVTFGRPARNVEGPPGLPWAALPYETCGYTLLVWGTSAGTAIEPHRDEERATTAPDWGRGGGRFRLDMCS
jgi:hypothetical protein